LVRVSLLTLLTYSTYLLSTVPPPIVSAAQRKNGEWDAYNYSCDEVTEVQPGKRNYLERANQEKLAIRRIRLRDPLLREGAGGKDYSERGKRFLPQEV
jgi:hypothetical protein